MAKGYWKAVLAAAFFIVAGVCYGGSLFREGSIVLELSLIHISEPTRP